MIECQGQIQPYEHITKQTYSQSYSTYTLTYRSRTQ